MTPELWKAYRAVMADEVMASHHHKPAFDKIIWEMLPPGAITQDVLCVGCGDGTELRYFPKAIGVSLNVEGLRGRYDIVQADMHALPFRDKAFAGVFCKDTWEHALAPTIALSEMCRVSREWICLVVPDQDWGHSPHHTIIPTAVQTHWMAGKLGWALKTAELKVSQLAPDGPHTWTLHVFLLEPHAVPTV